MSTKLDEDESEQVAQVRARVGLRRGVTWPVVCSVWLRGCGLFVTLSSRLDTVDARVIQRDHAIAYWR